MKKKDDALSKIIKIASEHDIIVDNIALSEPTLEDVFINKTGKKFAEIEVSAK